MTIEPQHVDYGTPVSEWIALIPGELPRDAVGLWQIVPDGRETSIMVYRSRQDMERRGPFLPDDEKRAAVGYGRRGEAVNDRAHP